MKMSHKFAALICASLTLASVSALAAMSNEEFVQQEIKFEKQLGTSKNLLFRPILSRNLLIR